MQQVETYYSWAVRCVVARAIHQTSPAISSVRYVKSMQLGQTPWMSANESGGELVRERRVRCGKLLQPGRLVCLSTCESLDELSRCHCAACEISAAGPHHIEAHTRAVEQAAR